MRTDLFSFSLSSRELLITCQVNTMGCNVSKDGNEKNKNGQTNSSHSTRQCSAEKNGENKRSQRIPNESGSILPIHYSPEQVEQVEPPGRNTIDTNQVENETGVVESVKNESSIPESQVQQSIPGEMQASKKTETPLDDEIDPDDPEVNQAAAKIQASFRGHKVRKDMKKQEQTASNTITKTEEEEELDIDLDDPNVEKAATKIQASFRGHMVRKQVNPQKENPA